ncbi:Growth arrest-specific protein [Echinococcus granulosus]|uniref:Dynein regulatory complex subunit 4 n=1 Tax=Echinococcus granulosus TaxID=6210 RepID=W6UF43_ECHGR|nr:Growth arrest-specific protein [Echinococcus granulosus]EUB60025.1 Growth arrest-specific protein [Echinococcus granulosus]
MVDVKPLNEMTREELEAHVGRLRQELEREREDRNWYQVERDKVSTFWTIAKHQLQIRNAELRVAQEAAETVAEQRERELTAFRLRVRQLEAFHASQLAEVKAEMVSAVELATQEAKTNTRQPRLVEEVLRKEQADHNELVQQMKLDQEKQLHELRQSFEQQSEAERKVYMEKMRQVEERLDLQRRTEIQIVEESKNEQISVLIKNHEKDFMDIKNYYRSITANNVNLIDNLKSQLEELQKNENRIVKENSALVTRNRTLETDLSQSQKACNDLKRALENHERDVKALKNARVQLKEFKKTLSDTKLDNEALLQRLKLVSNSSLPKDLQFVKAFYPMQSAESERDELYDRFNTAVAKVKESCGLKNALLERRMTCLGRELERAELLRLAKVGDSEEGRMAAEELEGTLAFKDDQIKNLNYELARVCKAYNDLLDVFKRQLEDYGIRPENLGFQVVKNVLINGGKLQLGKAPAGLITVPPA